MVTLHDFTLSLETIDIGASAQAEMDKNLYNNKMYIHGLNYKTTPHQQCQYWFNSNISQITVFSMYLS